MPSQALLGELGACLWLPPLPLGLSDCSDTVWPDLELRLGSGRPLSVAAGSSAFNSLLLSLFSSAFCPFFPCRLGLAAGEAGSFALGEELYQAGRNIFSSRRKSMFWGMALPSQSRLSFCVSGRSRGAL